MLTPLTIRAADGYPLACTLYSSTQLIRHGTIIVAGATGVPQGFYRRFAEHASARGYRVMTFDYRGIGQSAPATLKGFGGNFLDWGRLDLAAVIEGCAMEHEPLFIVGHSYGGSALGLAANHARVSAMYTFGTGAGWHGWMPWVEQVRVKLMWHVMGPLLVKFHGYLAWRRLRLGEDLPLGVYQQWKCWCRYPHFFFDDPTMSVATSGFKAVRIPIVAANASGDRWAPPRSRDAFMQGYVNASWCGVDINDMSLGHMGYFRSKAQPLWDTALEWLEKQGNKQP